MRAVTTLAAAAALIGVMTTAAAAAETGVLSRNIASTATGAEKTATEPMAVRVAVRESVKQLIVTAGPKPQQVIEAIDAVFAACRPAPGQPVDAGFACPTKQMTYSALLEVRGLVVALLEAPTAAPAAVGTGSSAISSFPVTTAGGAYYTQLGGNQ